MEEKALKQKSQENLEEELEDGNFEIHHEDDEEFDKKEIKKVLTIRCFNEVCKMQEEIINIINKLKKDEKTKPWLLQCELMNILMKELNRFNQSSFAKNLEGIRATNDVVFFKIRFYNYKKILKKCKREDLINNHVFTRETFIYKIK